MNVDKTINKFYPAHVWRAEAAYMRIGGEAIEWEDPNPLLIHTTCIGINLREKLNAKGKEKERNCFSSYEGERIPKSMSVLRSLTTT